MWRTILIILFCFRCGVNAYAQSWAENFGGTGTDGGHAVVTDSSGNVFATGWFSGSATFGGITLISSGGLDVFITKVSPSGVVSWAKRYGGVGDETATSVALDASGNIFLGGYFSGTANLGGTNLVSAGQNDIFLAKYDSSGNHLWSQRFGGTNNDVLYGLAVDSSGNVIITGTYSATVNFGGGPFTGIFNGDTGYLCKYSPTGGFIWAKSVAGGNANFPQGVALDSSDNVIFSGYFFSSINLGGGSLNAGSQSNPNIFIGKYTPTGTFTWGVAYTNTHSQRSLAITVDRAGNVETTGDFNAQCNLGGGNVNGTAASSDMWVAKYSGADGSYVWANTSAGTLTANPTSISCDAQTNVLMTGYYQGTLNINGHTLTSLGVSYNVIMGKWSSSGSLINAQSFGGSLTSEGFGIAANGNNAIVTGAFSGSGTFAGQSLTSIGSYDVFLFQIGGVGTNLNVVDYGAVGNCATILVNASSGSPTVTANSGTPFSAADVGKIVQIYGGGPKTTITSTGWGSSPTNNADLVAQITAFVNNTTVTLDRNCGATTNAATMTYGTNNVTAFSNCIAACSSSYTTIHIPAGNYLLMNPSALSASFTQSGTFDAGTPALTIRNGSIHFWGDGTNSSILTGNGAWQNKGIQASFRGYMFDIQSVTNNGSLVFSNLQFNGSATRNHSQLWTSFPAAPTDGSGWDNSHHAIRNGANPTTPSYFGVTNCLFVHWHGETIQGIDSGLGTTDFGNFWAIDGNATFANFNGVHSYHDFMCDDYYQFAEDGQFVNVTGVNIIKNGTITNIDHGFAYVITGAQSNTPAPSFIISNNVFGIAPGSFAIGTAGTKNMYVLSNYLTGGIFLGIAGNQGTMGSSNIVIGNNVFSNSQSCVVVQGDSSLNLVQSVIVTNNTGTNTTRWADAVSSGYSTNVTFSNNRGDGFLHSIDASGQLFIDDPSNRFIWVDDDTSGETNYISYGFGYRHRLNTSISGKKFVLVSSNANQIPPVARMLVTNAGSAAITAYISSTMNYAPITIAPGTSRNFYWDGMIWENRTTNNAATCDWFNVQAAIDISNPGDTVIVPPGTCDYVFRVQNTNAIYLVTANYLNPNLGITTIQDSITNASDQSASSCFNFAISPVPVRPAQFAGFKFVIGSRATRLFDSGTLHLSGRSQLVRVNNNTFSAKLNIGIGGGDVFGVIDHNIFDALGQFTAPMKLNHDTIFGGQNGDGAWALPPWTNNYVEDASAIYIENNTFTNTSGAPGLGIDSQGGAKLVVRSNIFSRMIAGGHGTETTQRERGSRVKDVYLNVWVDNFGDSECGHYRSGTGMVFSNEVHNSSGFFTIRAYRLDSNTSPWGQAIGTNAWDLNSGSVFGSGTVTAGSGSGTMNDSTANWTPHQWQGFSVMNANTGLGSWVIDNTANSLTYNISTFGTFAAFNTGNTYQFRKVITILDEPGRGRGMLMSNSPPVINGIVQWPLEQLEPIYSWSNTFFSVSGGQTLNNGGYYPVVQGQELFNTNNPAFVPYTYPHPLVGGPITGPLILSQPQSTNIFATQTATFSITIQVTGLTPVYYWITNGVSDGGVNGSTITFVNCPTNLNNMTVQCLVSNIQGTATSATATLGVLPDPVITVQPANVTTSAGLTAHFAVTATGQTVLSYQWSREGVPISGATQSAYTTPTLVIGDNNSHYAVTVTDSAGSLLSATATLTVLVDPVISSQPTNVTVGVGSTATFRVTASGQSALSYQWSKNGSSIGGATQSSYTTPATILADSNSIFFVVVSDTAGSLQSVNATLTVTNIPTGPDPVITFQPQSTNIFVTQTSTFSVGATGNSALSYQWRTNGVNVASGGTSSTLTIGPAPIAWSGMAVLVVVSDLAGSITSSIATLTVGADPVITSQPQSISIFNNQNATFNITVSGQTAISYQWKTNGVNAGTNGPALGLGPCPQVWNGMSVLCVVSDSAGSVTSSTATLTIGPDPVISGQPVNVTTGTGGTAMFQVTASGQSTLSYLWSRNGSSIAGATASFYQTPTLNLGNNGDTYFVDVTDLAGTLRSSTATLTVTNGAAPPSRVAKVNILRVGSAKTGP